MRKQVQIWLDAKVPGDEMQKRIAKIGKQFREASFRGMSMTRYNAPTETTDGVLIVDISPERTGLKTNHKVHAVLSWQQDQKRPILIIKPADEGSQSKTAWTILCHLLELIADILSLVPP